MSKEKLVECVPNFSEGRDLVIIDKIVDCFRGRKSLKLLDYSNDIYHNRMVVTVVGETGSVKDAIINAIGTAISLIDYQNAPPVQSHNLYLYLLLSQLPSKDYCHNYTP